MAKQTSTYLGQRKKCGLDSAVLLDQKDGQLLGSKYLWPSYVNYTNSAFKNAWASERGWDPVTETKVISEE